MQTQTATQFDLFKAGVIAGYKALGGPEDTHAEIGELEQADNVEQVIQALDGLGFNGYEAYEFALECTIDILPGSDLDPRDGSGIHHDPAKEAHDAATEPAGNH